MKCTSLKHFYWVSFINPSPGTQTGRVIFKGLKEDTGTKCVDPLDSNRYVNYVISANKSPFIFDIPPPQPLHLPVIYISMEMREQMV